MSLDSLLSRITSRTLPPPPFPLHSLPPQHTPSPRRAFPRRHSRGPAGPRRPRKHAQAHTSELSSHRHTRRAFSAGPVPRAEGTRKDAASFRALLVPSVAQRTKAGPKARSGCRCRSQPCRGRGRTPAGNRDRHKAAAVAPGPAGLSKAPGRRGQGHGAPSSPAAHRASARAAERAACSIGPKGRECAPSHVHQHPTHHLRHETSLGGGRRRGPSRRPLRQATRTRPGLRGRSELRHPRP